MPRRVIRKKAERKIIDLNDPANRHVLERMERQMDKLLSKKTGKLTAAEKREKIETDAKWESILENIKRDQPLLKEYGKKIALYKQGKISRAELDKAYNEMWKKLEAREAVNWKNVMR